MLGVFLGVFLDWLRHQARLRRWTPEQALGRRGEDLAHRFLRRQGYTIVARNYRSTAGGAEADLIAWEGATLVVIEVKSRQSDQHGPPERALAATSAPICRRVARAYARKTDTPWPSVRCDVVTVVLTSRPRLQLVRNAFNI